MSVFRKTIDPILRSLKVDSTKAEENHVTLQLDNGLTVHLVGNWKDNLIIMSNIGGVQSENREALLWRLLEENLFCDLPQIQISASAADQKLILWTQDRLGQLDSRSALELFQRFVTRVEEVTRIAKESTAPAAMQPPVAQHRPGLRSPEWMKGA